MKKIFLIFFFTAITCAVYAQTKRIMPLGNSITQGDNIHRSYRFRLWEMLKGAGVDFDFVGSLTTNNRGTPAYSDPAFDRNHEGHWGWLADQLLAGLPGWLQNYTPDIVLMHVGSNDAFNNQATVSTVAELEQIIDVLRADNPTVVIFLAKLIPTLDRGRNTWVNALNAEIPGIVSRKSSAASPVIMVDQNTGFNAATDTYDGVHPDSSGEEKIAQKWFDAIMTLSR